MTDENTAIVVVVHPHNNPPPYESLQDKFEDNGGDKNTEKCCTVAKGCCMCLCLAVIFGCLFAFICYA